jgi:hypothetical protein
MKEMMKPTTEMIDAGAAYLCGYSREQAMTPEATGKFEECCRQAEQVFKLMQEAANPSPVTSDDLQEKLADAEPVNNHPNLW